ncbi:MAG: 4Fe-4S ferredoxin [Lentisphaerae bacterium]|nr:4Fe-4S ferredoxin [Lentisphaerota bacterium]
MKRQIITIDEALCNGCGECISGCAEGALQLVDGKAKLVKEQFCDGFGDCIGTCPTGALKIEERDSEVFDAEATKINLLVTQGPEAVARMEEAERVHSATQASTPPPRQGGCPGSMARFTETPSTAAPSATSADLPGHVMASDLQQWPVQLHLVQPGAPFFKNRELVVLSTCSPIASADVHWRYIRGRGVVVACPKLDKTEPYAEKLAGILRDETIPKVIVLRMEVPCCGGLTRTVQQAVAQSGRTDLVFEEVIVGVDGTIRG